MSRTPWAPRPLITRASALAVAVTATVALAACGGGDSDGEDTTEKSVDLTSAPDARWADHAGVQAPEATSGDCATETDRGGSGDSVELVSWSEQSPQCAVIAAMAGQTLLDTTGDDDWPGVASEILAPGEGKDQWVQARALVEKTGHVDDAPAFAGFKITDYTDEAATVLLAVNRPDGTTDATPTQLAWQAGRWQLVLPTQSTAVDATPIESLDGFTEFGPETTDTER